MTPFDQVPYRHWFPWLHLFQSIGLSLSVRQLVVAVVSIFVLWAGHAVIDWVTGTDAMFVRYWYFDDGNVLAIDPPGPAGSLAIEVARPWQDVVMPASSVVHGVVVRQRFIALCHGCWSIAAWSLFGIALCRLAAHRFAYGTDGELRKSVRFAAKRTVHGIVGPLIPGAAGALILLPALLLLYFAWLPAVGTPIAILASPIVLLCCLAAAYLLIALLLGWPLMLAAIATDDCDGFGGLSRSYSLWTGRPWYFLWCAIVSAIVGVISLVLAGMLGMLTLKLADAVIQTAIGSADAAHHARLAVQAGMALTIKAYAVSFFWTSTTISYLLLRKSVDGLPIDTIAPDDQRSSRDPLPVVGIAAMEP